MIFMVIAGSFLFVTRDCEEDISTEFFDNYIKVFPKKLRQCFYPSGRPLWPEYFYLKISLFEFHVIRLRFLFKSLLYVKVLRWKWILGYISAYLSITVITFSVLFEVGECRLSDGYTWLYRRSPDIKKTLHWL